MDGGELRKKKQVMSAAQRYGLVNTPAVRFELEDCPFETVQVDVTHRCNMGCLNCYIPNRDVPDLDAKWIEAQLKRLPPRRYVRIVGAEPTMRDDLPELIAMVKACGHHPFLLTNGLKIADRAYLRELKDAGLSMVYLSLNGVFDDGLYKKVDGMRCAAEKRAAFENIAALNILTSIGMIIVRDVSEHALKDFWEASLSARCMREVHIRSVGQMGRFTKAEPLTLSELIALFFARTGLNEANITKRERTASSLDFQTHGKRVQLTQWPDLGSTVRGRLTPEGKVAPFFEHAIENENGY
jgi:uncharacterized radical SAM superfamily Fe-S cluster-containing enzyme